MKVLHYFPPLIFILNPWSPTSSGSLDELNINIDIQDTLTGEESINGILKNEANMPNINKEPLILELDQLVEQKECPLGEQWDPEVGQKEGLAEGQGEVPIGVQEYWPKNGPDINDVPTAEMSIGEQGEEPKGKHRQPNKRANGDYYTYGWGENHHHKWASNYGHVEPNKNSIANGNDKRIKQMNDKRKQRQKYFRNKLKNIGKYDPHECSEATCSGEDCEQEAISWIDGLFVEQFMEILSKMKQAKWDCLTNIKTCDVYVEAKEKLSAFKKKIQQEHVAKFNYKKFKNAILRRRFEYHDKRSEFILTPERLTLFNNIVVNMSSTYGSAKICPFENSSCDLENEGLSLNPEIENILEDSGNKSWDELVWVWKHWRDQTGRKMRKDYEQFIDIYNEAGRANGFKDAGEMLLNNYVRDLDKGSDFKSDLENVWKMIKPLYVDLHAYVRWKLRGFWGEKMKEEKSPISAHLFGNMWAQNWQPIFEMVKPYPNAVSMVSEVNKNLRDQNFTVQHMLDLVNDFYKKLGLEDMTMSYNTPCSKENTTENRECVSNNPLVEKPSWEIQCQSRVVDMYNNNDYRILACGRPIYSYLYQFSHEMGHIQFFIQVKHLPIELQEAPNHGFDEALGELMSDSFLTPKHMESIGLVKTNEHLPMSEDDINYLLNSALQKVVILPWAIVVEQFRWALYNSSVSKEEMTYKWWELREKYQGINPPVMRTELDFDPGSKMHVPHNIPYIRYFIAGILEFQFYKNMCLESGNYDPKDPLKPLHLCDFSHGEEAKRAGLKLKEMMQKGSSQPWPETLYEMTGKRNINAKGILEYYKPLQAWLDKQLNRNNVPRGWNSKYNKWIKDRN